MSSVYRVGSINYTTYFNTAKEAYRDRPGGELPESVTKLDAAGECNRLERYYNDSERLYYSVRMMLYDLVDVCPNEVLATPSGTRAAKFLSDNPLPPVTCADRDGGRDYSS